MNKKEKNVSTQPMLDPSGMIDLANQGFKTVISIIVQTFGYGRAMECRQKCHTWQDNYNLCNNLHTLCECHLSFGKSYIV